MTTSERSLRGAAEQLVNALTRREVPLTEREVRMLLSRLHQCRDGGSCVACRAFIYLDTLRFPESKAS